jgi:hypothetical protein
MAYYSGTTFDVAIDSMISMVERVPAKLGWSGPPLVVDGLTPPNLETVEELESRCDEESAVSEFSAGSIAEISSNKWDRDWESTFSESRDTADEGNSTCSTIERYHLKHSESQAFKKYSRTSKSTPSMNAVDYTFESKTQPVHRWFRQIKVITQVKVIA